jgi:hypothetical protein
LPCAPDVRAAPFPEVKIMPERANDEAQPAVDAFLARLETALKACEALGDDELTRHTGRKILAVAACAAEELLRDGGQALRAAPDKVGAFFDRIAAGYVQAIEGLHKRVAVAEAGSVAGSDFAPYRPRASNPLANAWDPISPRVRREAQRE